MTDDKVFTTLQKKIGVTFKKLDTLRQAFVHRSYLNENPSFHLEHNERLEFLGDAVLELIVTDYLYDTYSTATEGEMTNWRASVVNSKMLAQIAGDIDINDCLYLSRGEAKDATGKARQYILANAFESLIGAIYLDQGYKSTEKFLHTYLIPRLPEIIEKHLDVDPKSRFQEIAQEQTKITPHYDVLEETGPDHAKWFKMGLYIGKDLVATGEGESKQEAQVDAARNGLREKNWK
ncbi:MAG: ribonuclease III [bacterium]|nr:ribonuclease III [bacterium]